MYFIFFLNLKSTLKVLIFLLIQNKSNYYIKYFETIIMGRA